MLSLPAGIINGLPMLSPYLSVLQLSDSQLLDIQEPLSFIDQLKTLDKSNTYFLYCRSGARSAQACQIFKQHGISNCFNLLGGILDWQGELKMII